jgi:hypothetical protein
MTYFIYHQLQHKEIMCSAHNMFVCFVCISEQTAIISLYSINLPVFIIEVESVYCAARTGVFKSDSYSFVLKRLNHFFLSIYLSIYFFIK